MIFLFTTTKHNTFQIAVYHYHAMILQRTFRGFYSRRYYHDYSARKAYIQSVVEKGNKLRETLNANLEAQRQLEEQQHVEAQAAEFKKVTSNLHHLISTRSMPGIYNSPYVADNPPTAMGIPGESEASEPCGREVPNSELTYSTIFARSLLSIFARSLLSNLRLNAPRFARRSGGPLARWGQGLN
jgi:hypothetical protein